MAVKKNVEVQDHEGNIYYPHTAAKVVFLENGMSLEEQSAQMATQLGDKAPSNHNHDDRYFTENECDNRFQPKGNYVTTDTHQTIGIKKIFKNPYEGETMWGGQESGAIEIQSAKPELPALILFHRPNRHAYFVGMDEIDAKLKIGGYSMGNARHAILDDRGGELTGILTAKSNTSYTTRQVRNVILSPNDADINAMQDGDIWIKYV